MDFEIRCNEPFGKSRRPQNSEIAKKNNRLFWTIYKIKLNNWMIRSIDHQPLMHAKRLQAWNMNDEHEVDEQKVSFFTRKHT